MAEKDKVGEGSVPGLKVDGCLQQAGRGRACKMACKMEGAASAKQRMRQDFAGKARFGPVELGKVPARRLHAGGVEHAVGS